MGINSVHDAQLLTVFTVLVVLLTKSAIDTSFLHPECSGRLIPDIVLGVTVATTIGGVQWQDYVDHLVPSSSWKQAVHWMSVKLRFTDRFSSFNPNEAALHPPARLLTPEQQKIQELEAHINRLEREKDILKNVWPLICKLGLISRSRLRQCTRPVCEPFFCSGLYEARTTPDQQNYQHWNKRTSLSSSTAQKMNWGGSSPAWTDIDQVVHSTYWMMRWRWRSLLRSSSSLRRKV